MGESIYNGYLKNFNSEVSNNVITPFYTKNYKHGNIDMSCSYISQTEPDSIYIWFNNGRELVDIKDNDLSRNYFKIISQPATYNNKDDVTLDNSYNIIDIRKVTVKTIEKGFAGINKPHRNIEGVKIDISRNYWQDLSSTNNPYSFSQHEKIYIWWDSKTAKDEGNANILQDISYNEIWDASAQSLAGGSEVGISGALITTTRKLGTFIGDMPDSIFYGFEFSNNIIDMTNKNNCKIIRGV